MAPFWLYKREFLDLILGPRLKTSCECASAECVHVSDSADPLCLTGQTGNPLCQPTQIRSHTQIVEVNVGTLRPLLETLSFWSDGSSHIPELWWRLFENSEGYKLSEGSKAFLSNTEAKSVELKIQKESVWSAHLMVTTRVLLSQGTRQMFRQTTLDGPSNEFVFLLLQFRRCR